MNFQETPEQLLLRQSVAELARRYGHQYVVEKAKSGEKTSELWLEAGRQGFLGVGIPEEYGGGGAGIYELQIVIEELSAGGCPLLLIVVSPAICGTVIAQGGTEEQKKRWLPGIADGTVKVAFAITEPDAGSNSHRISTTGRRQGDGWVLSGRKIFISGVDECDAVLVVARTEEAKTGKLRPALFVVPTEATGLEAQPIPMAFTAPERQFSLFMDDVRLPADALVGGEDATLPALFAGLNPERITVAAWAAGMGRFAIERAVRYANERKVWDTSIGAHQGLSHPLAVAKIELELARLAIQKAAWLFDHGDLLAAGEAANMAKYAAAEAAIKAVDQAVQIHGGNGMTEEYGIGMLYSAVRVARTAPVSREMILNFVAQHSLGLEKSY